MSDEKTLEDFLDEALVDRDIDYKIIVSSNGKKKRFYLISEKEDSGKRRVVQFEVKGDKVKQIL